MARQPMLRLERSLDRGRGATHQAKIWGSVGHGSVSVKIARRKRNGGATPKGRDEFEGCALCFGYSDEDIQEDEGAPTVRG